MWEDEVESESSVSISGVSKHFGSTDIEYRSVHGEENSGDGIDEDRL